MNHFQFVSVSYDFFRGGSFQDEFVCSNNFLTWLECTNPEINLGEVNGKHSDMTLNWFNIFHDKKTDYYDVLEYGNKEKLPGWLEDTRKKATHPTHVRLTLSLTIQTMNKKFKKEDYNDEDEEDMDDMQSDLWLFEDVDVVIPRDLWDDIDVDLFICRIDIARQLAREKKQMEDEEDNNIINDEDVCIFEEKLKFCGVGDFFPLNDVVVKEDDTCEVVEDGIYEPLDPKKEIWGSFVCENIAWFGDLLKSAQKEAVKARDKKRSRIVSQS